MIERKVLCEEIKSIYPEVGECGIDVDVDWDEEKKAWIVDLKRNNHELKTYLEPEDADGCRETAKPAKPQNRKSVKS